MSHRAILTPAHVCILRESWLRFKMAGMRGTGITGSTITPAGSIRLVFQSRTGKTINEKELIRVRIKIPYNKSCKLISPFSMHHELDKNNIGML